MKILARYSLLSILPAFCDGGKRRNEPACRGIPDRSEVDALVGYGRLLTR